MSLDFLMASENADFNDGGQPAETPLPDNTLQENVLKQYRTKFLSNQCQTLRYLVGISSGIFLSGLLIIFFGCLGAGDSTCVMQDNPWEGVPFSMYWVVLVGPFVYVAVYFWAPSQERGRYCDKVMFDYGDANKSVDWFWLLELTMSAITVGLVHGPSFTFGNNGFNNLAVEYYVQLTLRGAPLLDLFVHLHKFSLRNDFDYQSQKKFWAGSLALMVDKDIYISILIF